MVVLPLGGDPRGNHIGLAKRRHGLALGDVKKQAAIESCFNGIQEMRTRFLHGPRVPSVARGERVPQAREIYLELLRCHQQPSTIASTARAKFRHSLCCRSSARWPFRVSW